MYLIALSPVHHTSEKKLRNRSSTIPLTFENTEIKVYSGKRWNTRKVST